VDRLTENKLSSLLRAWGAGSYLLQDFLDACRVMEVDIKDMHVEQPIVGKNMYVFRCVPRGMSAPITLLRTFKG